MEKSYSGSNNYHNSQTHSKSKICHNGTDSAEDDTVNNKTLRIRMKQKESSNNTKTIATVMVMIAKIRAIVILEYKNIRKESAFLAVQNPDCLTARILLMIVVLLLTQKRFKQNESFIVGVVALVIAMKKNTP